MDAPDDSQPRPDVDGSRPTQVLRKVMQPLSTTSVAPIITNTWWTIPSPAEKWVDIRPSIVRTLKWKKRGGNHKLGRNNTNMPAMDPLSTKNW